MNIIKTMVVSLITFSLIGCGVVQSVSESTVNVTKALFIWDIRTIHLDLKARPELNRDDDNHSSPVVVRIYQLTNDKNFNSLSYQELLNQDIDALKEDLLASREVVLLQDTSISLDIPMDSKAEVVAVAAFYKEPDIKQNNWRLLLTRDDLHINKAREIIAMQYKIELVEEQ